MFKILNMVASFDKNYKSSECVNLIIEHNNLYEYVKSGAALINIDDDKVTYGDGDISTSFDIELIHSDITANIQLLFKIITMLTDDINKLDCLCHVYYNVTWHNELDTCKYSINISGNHDRYDNDSFYDVLNLLLMYEEEFTHLIKKDGTICINVHGVSTLLNICRSLVLIPGIKYDISAVNDPIFSIIK